MGKLPTSLLVSAISQRGNAFSTIDELLVFGHEARHLSRTESSLSKLLPQILISVTRRLCRGDVQLARR